MKKGAIYHLTSSGKTSWYGFIKAILGNAANGFSIKLVPIPTRGYPLPTCRPQNSVMPYARLQDAFGSLLPEWDAALKLCLEEVS